MGVRRFFRRAAEDEKAGESRTFLTWRYGAVPALVSAMGGQAAAKPAHIEQKLLTRQGGTPAMVPDTPRIGEREGVAMTLDAPQIGTRSEGSGDGHRCIPNRGVIGCVPPTLRVLECYPRATFREHTP